MSLQKNTGWAEVIAGTQAETTQQNQNRVGENMSGYAALTQPTTAEALRELDGLMPALGLVIRRRCKWIYSRKCWGCL